MNSKWEYRKIGDVCIVERGGSPRPIDQYITNDANGINWIKIGDTSESMYITETAQKIKPEGMKKSRYVQPGDFLLSNSMSFGRPYILKTDGCIHDGWLVLRDKNSFFDKRFLYYYLSAKPTYEKFKMIAVGGVVNNLNSEMVRKISVPVPCKAEQIEIANLLDIVNRIILKRKQTLQKLDELVKARFVELFGDPISNPMNWNKRTLKEVCTKLNDGTHFSPESFSMGDYKYITAKNIKTSGFDFSNITYVPEAVHRPIFERCNPEQGDVLYIKDGATTGIAIVNTLKEEFTLLSSVALLKQNRNVINGYFLAALLNNADMYSDIRNNMGGAAITRLTIAKLNAVKVIVPPLDLQNRFAAFVEQVDKSKVAVQKSLDEAQLLFDSLMQQYFE